MADERNNALNESIDVAVELAQPRLLAFLCAEWISVTRDEKPIIAGVFDKLYIPLSDFPAQIGFYIYVRVAQVYGSPIDVRVYLPDGKPYAKLQLATAIDYTPIPNDPNILQSVGQVNLIFPQHGLYWFEVRHDSQKVGTIPLNVQPPPESLDVTAGIPSGLSTEVA